MEIRIFSKISLLKKKKKKKEKDTGLIQAILALFFVYFLLLKGESEKHSVKGIDDKIIKI